MPLRVGQWLGTYRLLEPTGTAGPAALWRAAEEVRKRFVTLHVLPPALTSLPKLADRFQREMSLLTRLHHPNIPHVYDYGTCDGYLFLATPFASGLTLDYLLGQPWPFEEAMLVLEPLAWALDYAHNHQLIHRDLRPANVLIADGGRVILRGLGLCWAFEACGADGRPTSHLAPEQLRGQPALPVSDRYSLARIAFELLTGRPPFRNEVWPPELEPPPVHPMPQPHAFPSGLPLNIVAVLHRALAEDPQRRYRGSVELLKALAAADRAAMNAASPPAEPAETPSLPAPEGPSGPQTPPSDEPEVEPGVASQLRERWRAIGWRRPAAGLGLLALLATLLNVLALQPTAALLAGRGDHAAVSLAGGEVLIAGGCTNTPSSGSLAALARGFKTFGNRNAVAGSLDTALLYQPATGAWTSAGRLGQARCEPRAVQVAESKVVLLSGTAAAGPAATTAERYDRSLNSWSAAGRLLIARRDFALTPLASEQALVIGGARSDSGDLLASTERYDPRSNNWSLAASLGQARAGHSATLLASGQVLVVGGGTPGGGTLGSAERWDPATNAWTPAGQLQQPRAQHTATLLADGTVLVVGGTGERSRLASAERYDPRSNTWTRLPALGQGRAGHSATLLLNGQVLVVGGSGLNGDLATVERFNPVNGAWSPAAPLAHARAHHSASLLPDGRVLVVGGRSDPDSTYLPGTELYDPATNRWTAGPDLPS